MTASLLNPWGGVQIPDARLRLTVDAAGGFAEGDVTATALVDGQTVPVPFTVNEAGDLVGWWGPSTGFPVDPGYNVSTTFDVQIGNGAPTGSYDLTLDLVRVSDESNALASEQGSLTVNANTARVLWAGPVAKYATQGTAVKLPLTVYSPADGSAQLTLTIAGPGDDPATPQTEALAAGDVKVYGRTADAMLAMPLTLNGEGVLVGTWSTSLAPGYNPVTWYATVATGALVGNYTFGVSLDGGNADPLEAVVAISAPETHGEQPPGSGEDTTPPVVSITSGTVEGTTATFAFIADDDGTTFECSLTKDGDVVNSGACTSPKAYTELADGSYVFSVLGTNREGLVSTQAASMAFSIGAPPVDTTPPTVTITVIEPLGSTAQFELTANEPNVTFQCLLTKSVGRTAEWEPCESPVTFTNLKPATYTLSVRGTDLAGNVSDPFVSDPWTVSKGGSR